MVTYTVSSVLLYTLLIKEIENPENRELKTENRKLKSKMTTLTSQFHQVIK